MASVSPKVRMTVSVSKTTDREVRALLGARQMRRGELSRFVEQALQVQMFRLMVDEIKERNADLDASKLKAQIDRAVREVRTERRADPRRKKTGAAKEAVVA